MILIFSVLLITACATSMSPVQVNNALPNYTKAKLISQLDIESAIKTGKCKYLVKDREYVAPIAITVQGDLRKGAKGIDDWVILDGGNAYVLKSYKWVKTDSSGSRQLHLIFDTILCDE